MAGTPQSQGMQGRRAAVPLGCRIDFEPWETDMSIRMLGPVLLVLILQPAFSHAQEYPNRQVTFVVPFAPGGGTDVLGRMLGQKLTERFGKPFVIENKPGAGTLTAAMQV